MSRLYESLKRAEMESGQPEVSPNAGHAPDLSGGPAAALFELENLLSATMDVPSQSHLIALIDPRCLAAEKFRVLVTRLQNLRKDQELKSLLVTSSVINEGKTFVAGNLAVTLANHSGSRVLLVEGDLHRPALKSLLGLTGLQGLSHWWSSGKGNIAQYVYKINGMPLWFLGAGEACDQPSQILQSAEFAEAFAQLEGAFDWILVDSTPMLPTGDVNLWSRLVDGMLLVVREGIAPIKALQRGLASVDKPKLVGIVLNEASELGHSKYADQYYQNLSHTKTVLGKQQTIA
jgi:capsular exopolysaccharide synthesis family protein